MGLVVAPQHEARRLHLRDEVAVDAIDETGNVAVLAETLVIKGNLRKPELSIH